MYYINLKFILPEHIVKSVRDQAAYAVKKANDNGKQLDELLAIAKKGAGFAEVIFLKKITSITLVILSLTGGSRTENHGEVPAGRRGHPHLAVVDQQPGRRGHERHQAVSRHAQVPRWCEVKPEVLAYEGRQEALHR